MTTVVQDQTIVNPNDVTHVRARPQPSAAEQPGPLPTNGPAIAQAVMQFGLRPVPLAAPVYGDRASGKNPAINGPDWWARSYQLQAFEGCNVGICCGYPLLDGGYLCVLDPDHAAGLEELEALEEQYGTLPVTFTIRSGSGDGKHLYFRTHEALGGSKLAKHIDTRGVGGQVVAPGCRHYSGGQYVVEVNAPIAWAPEWLEERLKKPHAYRGDAVDPKLYPPIELTREMCQQHANVIGSMHGSYDVFVKLGRGEPLAPRGERHGQIDLRAMKILVQTFGPGITDMSVMRMIAPAYPEWSHEPFGAGGDSKNWVDAINGLQGAKRQYRPDHFSDAQLARLEAHAGASDSQTQVIDTEFRLTVEHCREQAELLGKRTADDAAKRKVLWRALALDGHRMIERSEVSAVLSMVLSTYPTASIDSVSALLAPHRVTHNVSETEIRDVIMRERDKQTALAARDLDQLQKYRRAGILTNDSDHPLPTAANIALLVRAELGANLRLNVRTLTIECRALPWDKRSEWRAWNEAADTTALIIWLQHDHMVLTPVGAYDAVVATAESNQVDPFAETLRALPRWDGTPRLDTWLVRSAGAEDSVYTRAVGAKFLLSIVARTAWPGCKVDTKLVLVGEQGKRKSMLLQALTPPGMFDSTPKDPREPMKDYLGRLHRFVLHEDAEMDTYSQSDVKADKAMITNRVDSFRKPYAKSTGTFARRFVLCGSTNEEAGFLRDTTGGRRYWPVSISTIDVEWLRANVAQLWAEAMIRLVPFAGQMLNGNEFDSSLYLWWLTPSEEAAARVVQEEHRASVRHEEELDAALRKPDGRGPDFWYEGQRVSGKLAWILARQAAQLLGAPCAPEQASTALRALGWRQEGTRQQRLPDGSKGQRWRPPADW